MVPITYLDETHDQTGQTPPARTWRKVGKLTGLSGGINNYWIGIDETNLACSFVVSVLANLTHKEWQTRIIKIQKYARWKRPMPACSLKGIWYEERKVLMQHSTKQYKRLGYSQTKEVNWTKIDKRLANLIELVGYFSMLSEILTTNTAGLQRNSCRRGYSIVMMLLWCTADLQGPEFKISSWGFC